ncbi:TRAP transporter large permease subunit [Celeribacter sp.]|uniref:TRAP transporter large permease subunit n=1 Tax=Celeribacter sp. TaxID=1890673 RepID=UPI003A956417
MHAGLHELAIPDAVATKSQGNFVKRFAEANAGWWTSLRKTLSDSMQTVGMIFMTVVCAMVFSLTFRLLGGEHLITDFIRESDYGAWHILIVVMILVFLLGFLFEWIEVTLIVLPVVAPIILSLDFGDHVASADVAYWFAILLAVNLQTSFLTPPMGPALFHMKAVPTTGGLSLS